MQNDKSNQDGPDVHLTEDVGPETRTTGLEGHAERPPCRRCGQPVEGRRRNGYCSDRCRMADRREDERRRRVGLLDTLGVVVEELRIELGEADKGNLAKS